jgi:thymidine kinase
MGSKKRAGSLCSANATPDHTLMPSEQNMKDEKQIDREQRQIVKIDEKLFDALEKVIKQNPIADNEKLKVLMDRQPRWK